MTQRKNPAKHSLRAMNLVGREWCGNRSVPRAVQSSLYVKDDGLTRVFATIDDGAFIGIGYPDEWQVIMREESARMFAWWVLWGWARDWFGLRTRLYFIALHAYCKGEWKLRPYKHRRNVERTTLDDWQAEEDQHVIRRSQGEQ